MESPDLPDMPLVFEDDPSDAEGVPSEAALGRMPAECTVLSDGVRKGLVEPAWADSEGVTHAWLTIEAEHFVENLEHYA